MKLKTTQQFIEDLKAKYGLKSNYAVAKFLGQTDTAVARWAHGKGSFSDDTAMQFADLLEIDPAYVVACMHAERAKLDKEKKLWERIATLSIGVAAALLMVWMLPIAGVPNGWLSGDVAVIAMASPAVEGSGALYIMSNLLGAIWWVFPALFVALLLALYPHNPHPKQSQDNLTK